jgi:hypothetical protein
MFCPKCGNRLTEGVKFCPKCGATVKVATETPTGSTATAVPPTSPPPQTFQPTATVPPVPNVQQAQVSYANSTYSELVVNRAKAFFGAAAKPIVLIDNAEIGELPNGGSLKRSVTTGKHCVTVRPKGKFFDEDCTTIWVDVPQGNVSIQFNCKFDGATWELNCEQGNFVTDAPDNTPFAEKPKPYIDETQLNVLGNSCSHLSLLRFLTTAFWCVMTIVQIAGDEELSIIIWNAVMTIGTLFYAIDLRPNKFLNEFKQSGNFNRKRLSNEIGSNAGVSVIGIVFYAYQIIELEFTILLLPTALEAVILILSLLVYTKHKSLLSRSKA